MFPPRPKSRVLIVRQDNRLGNLVLLTTFLRSLRQALPEAHLTLLTGEAYGGILQDWPWVDDWIMQPKRRHAREPWQFPGWLRGVRSGNWDLALEMSNHNTHSYYNCVLTVASGAPVRIGFDEPRNQNVLTHSVAAPDPVCPFALAPLRILEAMKLPVAAAAPSVPLPRAADGSDWRPPNGLELPPEPFVVLHVGGRGAKSWPLQAWRDLIPELARETGRPLVLIGGPDEVPQMKALRAEVPSQATVAPPLDTDDLAQFLHRAASYVGCDTGVMHLAAAVGTPTVALFFRSNPYHYGPLGEEHQVVLLSNPYEVEESAWAGSFFGLRRAGLHVSLARGEAARSGQPETGASARAAVTRAVQAALTPRT